MDGCDEDADACTNLPAAGCIVAGVCYAEGAQDPMNGCQQCTAALSPTSFSFVPVDMDPHDFCDRACDGMGACQGERPDAGVPESYITRGSGCDCRAAGGAGPGDLALLLFLGAGLVLRSRRRRR
jgi:MYXO-CTERM domain-containing protein